MKRRVAIIGTGWVGSSVAISTLHSGAADEVLLNDARPGVAEAYLLSTCNRTEVYLQPRDEDAAYQTVLELIFLQKAPELEKPSGVQSSAGTPSR